MIFNKKPDEIFSPTVTPRRAPGADPLSGEALARAKTSGLPARALIDAGLNIKGDLQTDGEVQVDGQITGDISCAHLTVGKDGAIFGDIKANEVVVRGQVTGTIRATRVILQESARVEGDIFHERLAIEEGARFLGASNAGTDAAAAQLVKLQQVADAAARQAS
jgi:cytoskeletal protein CcmA (bactofilin family)